MTPTTITQPRTTREPSIRLDREEQRVAAAHSTAAPRPPMMATTGVSLAGPERAPREWVVRPSCDTIRLRARRSFRVACRRPHTSIEVPNLAKTPRTWTGARTPSGLKRVRQAQSRHEVLQPRRSAAKTFVAKALSAATQPADSTIDPVAALAEALSALDRAAKVGAIHPNAAARRKSRLTRKVNAALGGAHVTAGGRVVKTTGKAAAAKAAKARIAAGKAGKAKGAQTAAGKARAALSKTARAEAAAAKAAAAEASATTARRQAGRREDDATKASRGQDDQDGRQEAGGDQGRTEGDRQGRSQARRPRPRSSRGLGPPTPRTPRSSRGVSIQARGSRRRQAGRARRRRSRRRLRAERRHTARPRPRPPSAVRTTTVAGTPELLAPVEARERGGVGDAGRDEVRAASRLRGSAGRRSRRPPGRRSGRRGPGSR